MQILDVCYQHLYMDVLFRFLIYCPTLILEYLKKCNDPNKNAENEHELLGFVYHTKKVGSSHR